MTHCDARVCVLVVFVGVLTVAPVLAQLDTVPPQLALEQAREILLRQSPALLRDRLTIDIAKADLQGASLRPNPEFEVFSESYPLFESRPGPFFNNQELTLRAGQTIETAGKRRKRMGVAEQAYAAAGSQVQNSVRELTLELKRRYFAVAFAKAQLTLATEILAQFDRVIRLNEARYKQGEISGLEFSRVRAERLRFFNDLLESQLQLRTARAALLELLGFEDVSQSFEVTDALEISVSVPAFPDLLQQAMAGRPDLVAEQQRLEQARRQLSLEKASGIPNITPSVGYKRDIGANTIAFGFNLPVPLFNRNQAGVARASAEIAQQEQQLRRTRLAVAREVNQTYQALETQAARSSALRDEYVPAARRAREIANESYRLGSLDLIGLLDAERIYREAVRTYNQSLFDYRVAIAEMEAAVGKEFSK